MSDQKRVKICHLTSVHQPLDIRIFHKQVSSLAAAGYDSYLVVRHYRDEVRNKVKIVSADPCNRSRLGRMTIGAAKVTMAGLRTKAKIFHFHDPELIPFGLVLKMLGKKVIYDAHEDIEKQILSKEYLSPIARSTLSVALRIVQKLVLPFFDAVVAATPSIATGLTKYTEKVHVVRNFPLTEELVDLALDRRKVETSICYVGGVTRHRSACEMVEAISRVNGKLYLAGQIVGDGLEAQLKSHPGWKNTEYAGVVDRAGIREILSKSIAGLVLLHPVPNHMEALPNKMFEYMAAGLPLICSDFPMFRELIGDKGCGIFVDPFNVEEVTQAMRWIFDHPSEALEMGRAGRQLVLEKYNWDSEKEVLIGVYDQIPT